MAALAGQLSPAGVVGAYLHGSLASGGWFPPKSDVDVIMVVERRLDPELRDRVALTCVDAAAGRPTLGILELSVVRREAASAGRFPMPVELRFREGDVERILAGSADRRGPPDDAELAIHVRSLRERGVVLAGDPIGHVFAPVPDASFHQALDDDLARILAGDHILAAPVDGVLDLCRGLWVRRRPRETGTPGKAEAGAWALGEIPRPLRRVVVDALEAYRDSRWIPPELRRTAARVWDVEALHAFRDALGTLLTPGTGGEGADGASPKSRTGHPEAASE